MFSSGPAAPQACRLLSPWLRDGHAAATPSRGRESRSARPASFGCAFANGRRVLLAFRRHLCMVPRDIRDEFSDRRCVSLSGSNDVDVEARRFWPKRACASSTNKGRSYVASRVGRCVVICRRRASCIVDRRRLPRTPAPRCASAPPRRRRRRTAAAASVMRAAGLRLRRAPRLRAAVRQPGGTKLKASVSGAVPVVSRPVPAERQLHRRRGCFSTALRQRRTTSRRQRRHCSGNVIRLGIEGSTTSTWSCILSAVGRPRHGLRVVRPHGVGRRTDHSAARKASSSSPMRAATIDVSQLRARGRS